MAMTNFPEGIVSDGGRWLFDGVDLATLAKEFGTPLYVMSEGLIRQRIAELRDTFLARYPKTRAYYASKAFQTLDMLRILKEEGLGVDVVSGGELYAALKAGIPAIDIVFHGNAKTDEEINYAVESGVGRLVVDNFDEIYRIERVAARANAAQKILFRVTPGVDSHTHRFISTGSLDSKFGIPLEASETAKYVKALRDCPHVEFVGLHFHVGSQLMENSSHLAALRIVLDFAARLSREFQLAVRELNMGGGFGIRYTPEDKPASLADFVNPMMALVQDWSEREKLPLPMCAIEPGRWIVGEAGLSLYRIVAVKEIPNIRMYVAVDGGMGDNIRPALYEAKYHAAIVGRAGAGQGAAANQMRRVTIAGRYCESGDILIRDIELPNPQAGDLLAVFSTGAYCYAMASNYNRVPRPALVMVKKGQARISVRRETYEDVVQREE